MYCFDWSGLLLTRFLILFESKIRLVVADKHRYYFYGRMHYLWLLKITGKNLAVVFTFWLPPTVVGCNANLCEPCTLTTINRIFLSCWRGHKNAIKSLKICLGVHLIWCIYPLKMLTVFREHCSQPAQLGDSHETVLTFAKTNLCEFCKFFSLIRIKQGLN